MSKPEQIVHLPLILYHWRIHAKSTTRSIASKPYVLDATRRVLNDLAQRRGWQAEAEMGRQSNFFRLRYSGHINKKCGVVIIDRGYPLDPDMRKALLHLHKDFKIRFLRLGMDSGLSRNMDLPGLRNIGMPEIGSQQLKWTALLADCDVVFFVDSALRPVEGCDLGQMVHLVLRNDVAMSSSLIWRGSSLWHGGLAPDITGLPFRLLKDAQEWEVFSYCWCHFNMICEALGASGSFFAVKVEAVKMTNGILAGENDLSMAEFALQQLENNRVCLITPLAQVAWNHNPPSAPVEEAEKKVFLEKWGKKVRANGLRNPNLRAAPDYDWTLSLPE